ncbi:hypothetical protein Tco_0610914 [Tanacetum coccineum]
MPTGNKGKLISLCQVKFATYSLLDGALTWWNSYVRTIRYDAAYGMPWKTENYCPRSKIKKLETELWNFVKKDESDKVEKYTGGLPDSIQGCVMASKQKMLQEAFELTRSLMDQKLLTYAARQAENKRKMDNNSRSNHAEESPYKRQNVARAYVVGPVGHLAHDCRSLDVVNTQRAPRTVQKMGTYFESGSQRHFKRDCPKLKNQNRRNTARNGEARGRAYALGGGEPKNDFDKMVRRDSSILWKLILLFPDLRVMVPLSNLIMALAVVRNGVPRIKGLFSSSFISKITKSTGYTCTATLTNMSSAIPKG